ncbi:MAG: Fe2+-dependent dioxygenase [Kiloniellaceae bacterium]
MLLVVPQLLNAEEVRTLLGLAEQARFVDGRASSGSYLAGAKKNLQIDPSEQQAALLDRTMLGALNRCVEFHDFALPRHHAAFRINRYEVGMEYGRHLDNPLIGDTHTLRSDISVTAFLSDPESYDGGELRLDTPFGVEQAKLFAGDAVFYATVVPHEVARVTRGVRLAVIGWVQSYVRDPARRQILYDMNRAREKLRRTGADDEAIQLLVKSYGNLMRMWLDG